MRVIAGTAKGRRLRMSDALPVRPTGDKVKGAVFNMLAPLIPDCQFLDLFAGSGAIGIEAWSRGALQVTFVEKNSRVYAELQDNLETVGYKTAICLLADYALALSRLAGQQFDIIFVDPPYQAGFYTQVMEKVACLQILKESGVLCLEHPKTWQLPASSIWTVYRQKTYGDTVITLLHQAQ